MIRISQEVLEISADVMPGPLVPGRVTPNRQPSHHVSRGRHPSSARRRVRLLHPVWRTGGTSTTMSAISVEHARHMLIMRQREQSPLWISLEQLTGQKRSRYDPRGFSRREIISTSQVLTYTDTASPLFTSRLSTPGRLTIGRLATRTPEQADYQQSEAHTPVSRTVGDDAVDMQLS